MAGRLAIEFSIEIRHRDGTPFVFERAGARTNLDPRLSSDLVGASIDVTDEVAGIRLLTMVRERTAGIEWATSTKVTLDWVATELATQGHAESRLILHGICQLDPEFSAGGRALAPGDWIWRTRLAAFGLNLEAPLGSGSGSPPRWSRCLHRNSSAQTSW